MSREVIFFAILPPGPWLLDVNNLNGVLGEDRGLDFDLAQHLIHTMREGAQVTVVGHQLI